MEQKDSYMGKGYPTEKFLVIHKPDEIPEHIQNRVIWVAKQRFSEKPIVRNYELGVEFRKLDVHFQDYGYLDITAFIRSFSDIFVIIPKKKSKNQVHILVQILHKNLQKIPLPVLDVDPQALAAKLAEKRKKEALSSEDSVFRNGIFEAYENKDYEILITKDYLAYGLNHLQDFAIWNVFLKAFLKTHSQFEISSYELNSWEQAVFTMNLPVINQLLEEKDQMLEYGFTEEELDNLPALLERQQQQITKVSALATRMALLSPESSPLPEILFSIGMLQSEKAVRESSTRNLSVYYLAKNQFERLLSLWQNHPDDVSHKAAAKVFFTCMEQNHPDWILKLWQSLSALVKNHASVLPYFHMADYLEQPEDSSREVALFCELSGYSESEQLFYLNLLCNTFLCRNQLSGIASLFGGMLLFYSKRTATRFISQLYPLVSQHGEAFAQWLSEEFTPSRINLCACWEFLSSRYSAFSQWEKKREQTMQYYKEKIASAVESEDALQLTVNVLAIFPEEQSFTKTHIHLLEEKYAKLQADEPYKQILVELFNKKNYPAVVSLSQSANLSCYRDDIWFQELVITAYREQQLLAHAIVLQEKFLKNSHANHPKYIKIAKAFAEDLYDYFYRLRQQMLPETVEATSLLRLLKPILKNKEEIDYILAGVLIQLLISDHRYLDAGFYYALVMDSNTIEDAIRQEIETLQNRLEETLPYLFADDLKSPDCMLEQILITCTADEIDNLLELGRYVAGMDEFEKDGASYRERRSQWGSNYSLPKALIAAYNYAEIWRVYADE
ncbi:MAG: hypothetical protein IJ367_01090, partial [Clostridia bacterium]|nr:hypothetical protein [Clostridia bacterium]